jgi:hypothetical protein
MPPLVFQEDKKAWQNNPSACPLPLGEKTKRKTRERDLSSMTPSTYTQVAPACQTDKTVAFLKGGCCWLKHPFISDGLDLFGTSMISFTMFFHL